MMCFLNCCPGRNIHLTDNSYEVCPIDWDFAKGPAGELLTPDLPVSPSSCGEGKYIDLVPYGLTYLRLTVFPVLYK